MNTLDLWLALLLAYGLYTGYRRGLLVEVVGIVAFIVSLWLGFTLLHQAIDALAPYLGGTAARRFLPVIGFSGVFLSVVFMINRFGWLLRKSLRHSIFGSFDSLAGAAVGVFTYAFGLSVFFWLMQSLHLDFPAAATARSSLLYGYLQPLAPAVADRLAAAWPYGERWLQQFISRQAAF